MNFLNRMILTVCIAMAGMSAFAQNAPAVADLVKQGSELNRQKKFAEAIEKYKAALATEPTNSAANYQMAFTLYLSGKGATGIPYLNQAIKASTNPHFIAGSYSLLGSIYGSNKQYSQAIDAYKSGIKADSTNQRIYYNLGIVYYRGKQYAEAGQNFTQALKLDPTYNDSQRMYALTAFHENKRGDAILGFCRFLMLEPNSNRSPEVVGNLQSIIQGGVLKAEEGYRPTPATKAYANAQNQLVGKALLGFAGRRYVSPAELLTAQLKAVFEALGTSPKKYLLADYFYKLSQTDNLATFARVITQKPNADTAKWLTDNADKATAYDAWLKENKPTL